MVKLITKRYRLGAKVNYGSHTFGLGYQQMFGDKAFPTLGGWVPQPYLVELGYSNIYCKKMKNHGALLMAMISQRWVRKA